MSAAYSWGQLSLMGSCAAVSTRAARSRGAQGPGGPGRPPPEGRKRGRRPALLGWILGEPPRHPLGARRRVVFIS